MHSGPALSRALAFRRAFAAITAATLGGAMLKLLPALDLGLFAAGAAQLTSLFTGHPVTRVENGWILADGSLPIIVTSACSATDYFLIVAALLAWRLTESSGAIARAILCGLVAAIPVSIVVNSFRIVVVAQAHRWIIDQFPESYGPFLHLAAGTAIFLPSLIALNVLLHFYTARRSTLHA